MFDNLEERKLHIRTFFAPCSCKCDFCCYYQLACSDKISMQQYETVLRKFEHLKDETGISVDTFIYNSIEYPMLPEQIRLAKEYGYSYEHCLVMNMNGTKIRKGEELSEWCSYLKRIGIKTAIFSFLGTMDDHDRYVGRKGYYSYIICCAKQLRQLGIKIRAHIFLRKEIMHELPELALELKDIFGDEIKMFYMEYLGSAKSMQDSFLTVEDFNDQSSFLEKYMDKEYCSRYKTESEWVRMAVDGNFPKMKYIEYVLYLDTENIDRILSSTPVDILEKFRQKNSRLIQMIPPIDELAVKYGDPECMILYDNRDVLRKWLNRMFLENDLDTSLLYSDTRCSVEWKSHERLLSCDQ